MSLSKLTKEWMNQQELDFSKKWQELITNLHWNNARVDLNTDNENTKLWKKLRKKYE